MMIVAVGVAAVLGEIGRGMVFFTNNPSIMTKVVLFAACSAFGQSFIFFTIATFGPLKVATVTTTRKIFSVLLSIFINSHPMSPLGWAGVGLGACGIAGELIPKSESHARDKKNSGKKASNSDKKENATPKKKEA